MEINIKISLDEATKLFTREEVAKRLNMDISRVSALSERHMIPWTKTGRGYMYPLLGVLEFEQKYLFEDLSSIKKMDEIYQREKEKAGTPIPANKNKSQKDYRGIL